MKSLAKPLVVLAIAALPFANFAARVEAKAIEQAGITDNQTTPDLVIDRNNYKQFAKTGLHLYPGEIVEIKVDHYTNLTPAGGNPILQPISYEGRKLYRASELGTAGEVTVESGPVVPFYLLWIPSAMARIHTVEAVVDQQDPSRTASVPASLK